MTISWKYNSIQGRFLTLVLACGLILLISTVIAQYFVTQGSGESASHILKRQQILQGTNALRTSLWTAEGVLTEHLLRPFPEAKQKWQNTFLKIRRIVKNIRDKADSQDDALLQITDTLERKLTKYDKEVVALMKLRLNAAEQHPSLYYARETMLPKYMKFNTAITLALEEIKELHDSTAEEEDYRLRLINVRHVWTLLISNFRMYIINRLGSFDNESLNIQVNDIEILYKQLNDVLQELLNDPTAHKIGIQNEVSLEDMEEAAKAWKEDFEKIRVINASPNWRMDIVILTSKIKPIDEEIISLIQKLEKWIAASATTDVTSLVSMADNIVLSLWMLLGIGLLVTTLGLFYLNRSILLPITMLTTALKEEANGISHIDLPTNKSEETQNLIEAFGMMRRQIHNRQAALEYQALHDALTGLPNRNLLQDRVQQMINTKHRDHGQIAIMMMDLDHFKDINDSLGHQVGDRILEQVGLRLVNTLRDSDTVARLGGDEFSFAVPVTNQKQALSVAKKILDALENEFIVGEHHLYIGGSIGIALYPEHGQTVEMLTQRADVAMYVAKRNGSGFQLYESSHDQDNLGRLALGNDLRVALDTEQLFLYYQPKLDMQTATVIGVEALIRWKHPVRGWVRPDEIIFIAEHTGLIRPMTHWVIHEAVKQCSAWFTEGLDINVAVNLSVNNLQDPELTRTIRDVLKIFKFPADKLIIEVTESAMMLDTESASKTLNQIDDLGVWISIDDFGTGFSSLAYLKQMPVDELKIDKSFIMNMQNNENDAVIVRSTIDLAKNLGLKVVAEGIEDKDTWDLLTILRCDYAQGFYMSKPVPAHEFENWMRERQAS